MSSTRRASGGLGYCQWPPLEPDDMSESLSRRWYVQTSGQSELCSLCGCTHLQFFILRDFVQCCASFWRESLACPRLGRGVLHWQLSGEGEAVFLNVAMLSWLVACTQVWRLGQVHESQPRSVPFPAPSSSSAAGFWVDLFCAHKPVTLVPCFMFPDPV